MFKRNLELISNVGLKERLGNITLDESRADISFCMTTSNDYLLMKNDVPFDDINNPRQAIKEHLKATIKSTLSANDIIITFGIGMCYLLDEVYNAYPSKIFVYEPDTKFLHFVLNNVDISEHLSSGRVYISDNLDDLMKHLAEVYLSKDKVEVVYLKNYAIVKNKELLELTQKVYDTCRSKIVDINTITRYSKQWLFNTLKNVSLINSGNAYKLSDLEDKFEGQTALVLGAGPSLNDNIEKIKANREKFVIFAVNKALHYLNVNGIVPDFAVCIDAMYLDDTLIGLEEYCSKINCIADIKSDSSVFAKNFRRVFVSFPQTDSVIKRLAEINDLKLYESGGTAALTALISAIKLGFDKVVLSGIDLAFKGDVAYMNGEVGDKLDDKQVVISNIKQNIVQVKSVTGELVNTREDYAAFIEHFETILRDLEYANVYNTTTFGAAIKGVKPAQLEQLSLLSSAAMSTPIILGSAQPFKLQLEVWTQEEMALINNVISTLAQGVFSPALVASIVKSPMLYQYLEADILKILQSQFDAQYAEEFIAKTKSAIKDVVERLQKHCLI